MATSYRLSIPAHNAAADAHCAALDAARAENDAACEAQREAQRAVEGLQKP